MPDKKHRKYFFYTVLVLISIAAIVGITTVAQSWNQPLSAAHNLPTYLPTKTRKFSTLVTDILDVSITHTPIPPTYPLQGIKIANTPTPLPSNQPTPAPLCGGPAIMTILAIGIDTLADNYIYGLADAIRIVRVDFVTPKVTVLSLPRDLWVEIPEISDHYGITHGKLNQAYLYGTEGMGYYDGPGEGPGLLAITLAHNFDLFVDHYSTVNMITMARIIDAIGGIDIYLEESVDDHLTDDKVDFTAGHHHLTGEQTIFLSRIRQQDSDINRIDRQTQVIYAIQERIISPSILPKIPQLITSFHDSIITDLSPSDLVAITCLVPHITSEKLIFTNLPEHLLLENRQYDPHRKTNVWVFNADFDVLRILLGYFVSGDWPSN